METSQDYAVRYFESGFIPVPVPLKEKAPRMKDWPNWRPKTKDALLSEFGSDPRNVGVLLGQASGGLAESIFMSVCSESLRATIPKNLSPFIVSGW